MDSHFSRLFCGEMGKREEGRGKREAGSGKREAGSGKREEGRGKRKEGRGKREEERGVLGVPFIVIRKLVSGSPEHRT